METQVQVQLPIKSKRAIFFCWVHDIIKKSFSSVHSLFLYVCAVQADYLRAAMPILRRNGPFYRVSWSYRFFSTRILSSVKFYLFISIDLRRSLLWCGSKPHQSCPTRKGRSIFGRVSLLIPSRAPSSFDDVERSPLFICQRDYIWKRTTANWIDRKPPDRCL